MEYLKLWSDLLMKEMQTKQPSLHRI
jgi:hypothetical protein